MADHFGEGEIGLGQGDVTPDRVGDAMRRAVAFGDQACGSVVDAVPVPEGGSDLIAVAQVAAVESGDLRVGAPDGPALVRLPLPYALPAGAPKRVKL